MPERRMLTGNKDNLCRKKTQNTLRIGGPKYLWRWRWGVKLKKGIFEKSLNKEQLDPPKSSPIPTARWVPLTHLKKESKRFWRDWIWEALHFIHMKYSGEIVYLKNSGTLPALEAALLSPSHSGQDTGEVLPAGTIPSKGRPTDKAESSLYRQYS